MAAPVVEVTRAKRYFELGYAPALIFGHLHALDRWRSAPDAQIRPGDGCNCLLAGELK
jgi:hypothetical protein